jgi:hypothetical protein
MLDQTKEADGKAGRFDLFIAPDELKNYGILETEKADDLFKLGYTVTCEKLNKADLSLFRIAGSGK